MALFIKFPARIRNSPLKKLALGQHDLGIDNIANFMAPFGFGSKTDIDIEGDLTYVLLSSEASLRRNVVIFRDWLIATIEAEKRSPIAAVASGRAGVSRIADSSATFN